MTHEPTNRPPGRHDRHTRRLRAQSVLLALHRDRPEARIELEHRGPFQLLMATILSAQCTDARVNLVTPELFRRWPTPERLAMADTMAVEEVIRSTGFYRAKARAIIGCSRAIVEQYSGEVPRTMEALSALPGVGRKTANVVLGGAFGVAAGVVVDTHVARVARRLRLTAHLEPVRIEADLMEALPQTEWNFASVALVLHGRYVCLARAPRCEACVLSSLCPSRGLAVETRARPPRGRGQG